jgi:TRAP-type C4-dicarboxylate transport system permease small subunit
VVVLTIVFSIYLTIYGGILAGEAGTEVSIALQMPMWIAYIALMVGGVLSFLNAIAVLIETLAGKGVE